VRLLPFDPSPVSCRDRVAHGRAAFPLVLTLTIFAATALIYSEATLAAGRQRAGAVAAPSAPCEVSILAYHRFGTAANDSMTTRTATFRSQLEYLAAHHHPVIPLRSLMTYLRTGSPRPPKGAVVITMDDGHRSVLREALPLVREFKVPVTLFIYPSAISNASYAMTWEDLQTLRQTGLFEVQSHTYWHPNFRTEQRRLAPAQYRAFAVKQLAQPRTVLERKLGANADLVAWPFGVYTDEAIAIAREVGYTGGFTLGQRCVTAHEDLMTVPRFLVVEVSRAGFISMLPRETH
jgi:peptidoglycan/xylan/chitin deacetylase (PgdA/CDA1 family)